MITTIQVSEKLRKVLNNMKESQNQSYEQVILEMIKIIECHRRNHEGLLIKGCKEMADENLNIARKFELIEDLNKWDW